MRALYDMDTIHIEITNACNKECACCTRFCGHHKKPFFMDLETVEKCLQSMSGFPHGIGVMGGEPTLHPEFKKICRLIARYFPRDRRGLWTNGARWEKYSDVIAEVFDPARIIYNDHAHVEGHHQPLMVASDEIVTDKVLMWSFIDNCWIQNRWSASMTPKGAFFCEVAAAQDMLLGGPGGYPLEPGWWKKTPADFHDQVRRYCVNCSAAIPMQPVDANLGKDLVSPSIAAMLAKVGSPRHRKGHTLVFDRQLSMQDIQRLQTDWQPWSHRPFRQCGPNAFLDEQGSVVNHKVFHKG